MAKLARLVPDRLGKVVGRTDITAALNYCFGRSVEDVTEYLEENFKLGTPSTVSTAVAGARDDAPGATSPLPSTQESQAASIAAEADEGRAFGETESTVEEVEPSDDDVREISDDQDKSGKPPPKDRPPPKPARLNVMERFARTQGFQKDGEDRFFHADGGWIAKVDGERFPWERRTANGDLVRRYWSKDHCLEQEPLQLEADIWALVDKFPEIYALVLSDSRGKPVEMSGARLRAMRDGGELTLFPASYRLVRRDSGQP
jgi:hypothetical protein